MQSQTAGWAVCEICRTKREFALLASGTKMPILSGMKHLLALALCCALPAFASAQDAQDPPLLEQWQENPLQIFDATEVDPDALMWRARIVVVFAETTYDPQYQEQVALLLEDMGELAERDVIVVTDAEPDERSPLRSKLRPHGFAMVLIDKDGRVALRKPAPWEVHEITRTIDRSPLRMQEAGSVRIGR